MLVGVVWELYKALGSAGGVELCGRAVLPRTSELAMPHLWDTAARLGEPTLGRPGVPLRQSVSRTALFTPRRR